MTATTTTQLIRVGHSPDPDDAFMFYAMTRGRIPLLGFQIEHLLEAIESLNQRALRGELEVTALSLHAYAYCGARYKILTSGTSMGDGYGPIVVAREPMTVDQLRQGDIAVAGALTTSALVLQLWLGRVPMTIVPFDRIMDAVRRGQVKAGVVIHEGQLTYDGQGLTKVVDLGEWWQRTAGLPLPLGVNGVRRDLPESQQRTIARLMRESIAYGLEHRNEALTYAQLYSRGLDTDRTDQFVGMYVNHWTEDCRAEGKAAMAELLARASRAGLLRQPCLPEFVS